METSKSVKVEWEAVGMGGCLMTLNEQQIAFVEHDPTLSARVLAGPGTGKSFTAVQFLERLAVENPGFRVRMLTFTRAATAEFATKMDDADLSGLGIVRPATVHSFALSTLLRIGSSTLPMPLRIPGKWETEELIRPHLSRRLKADGYQRATPTIVRRIEEEMSAGWQSLDPLDELYTDIDPVLGAAYVGLWKQHRRRFGYVLLAELPYAAGLALEDHGTESIELDLLLVDEYQDLNMADIKMIRLIHEGGVAVISLGDDDQSIYGNRLAAPEGILRFPEEFNTELDYPLTESRRCGKSILEAARAVIEAQPGRFTKPPLVPMAGAPDGTYAYLRFPSAFAELEGVASIIASRVGAGVDPKDIAVITRSRAKDWADWLKSHLDVHGVSLAWTGWVEDVLEEHEVRRSLARAHIRLESNDSLALWTLLHISNGIGVTFIDYVYDRVAANETFGAALLRLFGDEFPDLAYGRTRIQRLITETLEAVDDMDPSAAELDERGWGGWLLERMDRSSISEDAARLFEMVGRAVSADEGLAGFLSQLEPVGKDLAAAEGSGVRVMTMYSSKGLTVNTALVLAVEEGIVPFDRPGCDEAEERRLLYVAMTRATEMCVLTYAQRRIGPSARIGSTNVGTRNRSPFLSGLPGTAGDAQHGPTWVARLLAE